jgi:hypothetical protein
MAAKANALAAKGEVLLVPDQKVLPASFMDALKQGWKFTHETTAITIDKRHRDGTVLLTRPGFSKLLVPYKASAKKGFTFGQPQFA